MPLALDSIRDLRWTAVAVLAYMLAQNRVNSVAGCGQLCALRY